MTRGRLSGALLLAAALVAGCAPSTPSPAPASAGAVSPATSPGSAATGDWHDPSLPAATRAAALLAAMTIDEKIGQMTQLEKGSVDPQGVADLLLGSVLSGGGGAPTPNDAAELVRDGQGLPGRRPRDAARDPDPVRRRCRPRPQQRRRRDDLPAAGRARCRARCRSRHADRAGDGGRDGGDRDPVGLRAGRGRAPGRPVGARLRGVWRGPRGGLGAGDGVHRGPAGRGPDGRRVRRRDGQALRRRRRNGVGHVHDARLLDRPGRQPGRRRHPARDPPRPVPGGPGGRRADRHGVVLEHLGGQGPRRPPPADRRPQGRARVHGLRRVRLGGRRPGRSRLHERGREGDLGRHRHGDGPVRRQALR